MTRVYAHSTSLRHCEERFSVESKVMLFWFNLQKASDEAISPHLPNIKRFLGNLLKIISLEPTPRRLLRGAGRGKLHTQLCHSRLRLAMTGESVDGLAGELQ